MARFYLVNDKMCGIAGYIATKGKGVDVAALGKMTRAVAHRGPDDEGLFVDGCVGLGHRRLAIVDLTVAGHQPMRLGGTGLTIVFNGEIYNYIEIRAELVQLGHRFNTNSDTEVILVAYEQWGPECVTRFNGMWAFSIFDKHRGQVFCSRDRFGVKPFYYADNAAAFVFGSEIRQLLPLLPAVKANRKTVEEFLFAGITEPYVETFFDGVFKLPGGHNLIFDLDTNEYTIHRYYKLEVKAESQSLSLADAIDDYGRLLMSAVSIRLRADVTVGTCLSGGLDSSSLAAMAAHSYQKVRGEAFHAITAVSEQLDNDESGFAREVVDHVGLKWLTIKPTYEDFAASLDEVVRAQEEPFPSPSICMQYFVMRCARENNIPVLIDGQGGDETLLGYERYYAAHFLNLFRRAGVRYAFRSLYDCMNNNAKMSPVLIIQYLIYFSSVGLRYFTYRYRNRYMRKALAIPKQMKLNAKAVWDIFELQKLEMEQTNLPKLLSFEDKNSMWHSVETRLPFLDYRVVEKALSLPGESKIHFGWTKYVLRRYMEGKLPDCIVWRKNKLGFEAPDSIWIAHHSAIMEKSVCSSRLLEKLSKPGKLKKVYQSLDIRTRWRLYSVALWEKEFNVEPY